MGDKAQAVDGAEASISGGDDGIGAAAGGHQPRCVVDDTDLRHRIEVGEAAVKKILASKRLKRE